MKSSQLQIRVSKSQKEALKEVASLAGMDVSAWVLSKLFKNPRTQFLEKIAALAGEDSKFALADLGDFLSQLSRLEVEEVLQTPWNSKLDPILSNYVAAMLELCAHRHRIKTPVWFREIKALEQPYFASDLQSIRLYLMENSPPPFKARNIYIDTTFEGRV